MGKGFVSQGLCFFLSLLMVQLPIAPNSYAQTASTPPAVVIQGEGQPETFDAVLKLFAEPDQDEGLLIDPDLLRQTYQSFHDEALYLGRPTEIQSAAFKAFLQWLYLELFRAYRLQFLTTHYAQVLMNSAVPSSDNSRVVNRDELLRKFDALLPLQFFKSYPRLKKVRELAKAQLSEALEQPQTVRDTQDFLKGNIESVYVSLAFLDAHQGFVGARYVSSDERYRQEMERIESIREMIYGSMPILRTKVFKKEVDRYYATEVEDARLSQERAVSQLQGAFDQFLETQGKLEDLSDFLTGTEVEKLADSFARSLEAGEMGKFRERIANAYSKGVSEIRENLETELNLFKVEYAEYDTVTRLADANFRPRQNHREFAQWLGVVFRQQPLHWVIVEDFPFMQSPSDVLVGFVESEMGEQKSSTMKRTSALMVILSLSPFGKPGNAGTSWLTKVPASWSKWASSVAKLPMNATRLGLLGGGLYISGKAAFSAYGQFLEWRETQRMSRLTIEGLSLTNQVQEQAAFRMMVVQMAAAGLSLVLLRFATKGFFKGTPGANLKDLQGKLHGVARLTSKPHSLGALARFSSQNLKQLAQTIRGLSIKTPGTSLAQLAKATATNGKSIAMSLGIFFTQLMVGVPASLHPALKTVLTSIPRRLYEGASLGMVMLVMQVTVAHYINSNALKLFVWASENMGMTPPTYWQINSLNSEFKSRRDAFLAIHGELNYSVQVASRNTAHILQMERLLQEGGLSANQAAEARAVVAGLSSSTQHELRQNIARWHQQPEYRDIYESLFREFGFTFVIEPNRETPNRLTLILTVGEKNYAYQTTPKQLDELKMRRLVPDFTVSPEDVNALAEYLPAENGE